MKWVRPLALTLALVALLPGLASAQASPWLALNLSALLGQEDQNDERTPQSTTVSASTLLDMLAGWLNPSDRNRPSAPTAQSAEDEPQENPASVRGAGGELRLAEPRCGSECTRHQHARPFVVGPFEFDIRFGSGTTPEGCQAKGDEPTACGVVRACGKGGTSRLIGASAGTSSCDRDCTQASHDQVFIEERVLPPGVHVLKWVHHASTQASCPCTVVSCPCAKATTCPCAKATTCACTKATTCACTKVKACGCVESTCACKSPKACGCAVAACPCKVETKCPCTAVPAGCPCKKTVDLREVMHLLRMHLATHSSACPALRPMMFDLPVCPPLPAVHALPPSCPMPMHGYPVGTPGCSVALPPGCPVCPAPPTLPSVTPGYSVALPPPPPSVAPGYKVALPPPPPPPVMVPTPETPVVMPYPHHRVTPHVVMPMPYCETPVARPPMPMPPTPPATYRVVESRPAPASGAVKIHTPHFEAQCDRVSASGTNDELVLEGNVRLTVRHAAPCNLVAHRVVINTKTGTFRAEGPGVTVTTPVTYEGIAPTVIPYSAPATTPAWPVHRPAPK